MEFDRSAYAGRTLESATSQQRSAGSGLTAELGQQRSLGTDSGSREGLDLNSKEAGGTVAPNLTLKGRK